MEQEKYAKLENKNNEAWLEIVFLVGEDILVTLSTVNLAKDELNYSSVTFRNPLSGGGKSDNTFLALSSLIDAINQEKGQLKLIFKSNLNVARHSDMEFNPEKGLEGYIRIYQDQEGLYHFVSYGIGLFGRDLNEKPLELILALKGANVKGKENIIFVSNFVLDQLSSLQYAIKYDNIRSRAKNPDNNFKINYEGTGLSPVEYGKQNAIVKIEEIYRVFDIPTGELIEEYKVDKEDIEKGFFRGIDDELLCVVRNEEGDLNLIALDSKGLKLPMWVMVVHNDFVKGFDGDVWVYVDKDDDHFNCIMSGYVSLRYCREIVDFHHMGDYEFRRIDKDKVEIEASWTVDDDGESELYGLQTDYVLINGKNGPEIISESFCGH